MKRPLCFICLIFVITVALYRYVVPPPSFEADAFDGTQVILSGTVKRIEYRNGKRRLYLNQVSCDSSQIKLDSELDKFSEVSCICNLSEVNHTDLYSERNEEVPVRIGSRVMVTGRLRSFSEATNPGQFDQRAYYAVQNLYFSVEEASLCKISADYDKLRDFLYRIRLAGSRKLDAYLSEEDAGILKAMLLGDRSGLSETDRLLFTQSGISHILAISGLHISLLGMGLYHLSRKIRLPHTPALLLVIGFMVLYGMMTGMSNSAYRAILMFAIRLNAGRVGRTYDMMTALAVAAVCLLLEQPGYVFYAGFQLSFGAVIGMGCVLPALESLFGKKDRKKIAGKLRSILYASLSVAVVTFPILLYHYFEYSVYSILLNLLVLPTMGILVGSGVSLLLCGGIRIAGSIAASVCSMLLQIYRGGCRLLLTLPGAVQIIGRPKGYQLCGYALGVLVFLLVAAYTERKRAVGCRRIGRFRIAGMLILGLSVLCVTVPVRHGLRITFLDVGQGDGICIQERNGHGILIDCGSTDQNGLAEYRLIPFLKSQGIHTLDAVFLSHLDNDHTSAILELLNDETSGIHLDRIVLSAHVPHDEAWEKLDTLAKQAGVTVNYMDEADTYGNDHIIFTCLYPDAEAAKRTDADRNALSMILLLEYGSFQAVFTGDADETGELLALENMRDPFSCDLLKVAHHGSKTATGTEFLATLRPQTAVISCGKGNVYGHPNGETLERLNEVDCKVLRTDQVGAICITVDKDGNLQHTGNLQSFIVRWMKK